MSTIEKAIEKLNRQAALPERQKVQAPPPSDDDSSETHVSGAHAVGPSIELDFKALSRAGYLTPDAMQGHLAEQYRKLKRPLLKIARATGELRVENANVIAVTSALKGEGKTFTGFNLAMSIATERDVSVLLVDGDLFARSLSHLVGLDQGLGLADMLAESQIRLADIIVSTNVPKLRVVPAGHIRHHTTELLASERMRHAVRELASRYSDRIILLDTAPILLNSEAMLLEALAGQVLVVVQEGKTPQHAIQDALSLLGKKPVTGMVLNRCLRLFEGEYSPYYGGY